MFKQVLDRLRLCFLSCVLVVAGCSSAHPNGDELQGYGFLSHQSAGFSRGFFPHWSPFGPGQPDAGTDSDTTMSVAIADSADPVITGADAYSYTVTLTNTGAIDATAVSVATTLDASLTYVSSSGTGWACSRSLQVVTCTRATAAPGAQPGITINVATGGAAVAASSSAVASAANASNANAAQGTTVNLVDKDALAGLYLPSSSTQWSHFIARKGLSISVPSSVWLAQEASDNLSDSIGSVTLTAASTPTYQQTLAGFTRKGVVLADGTNQQFTAAAGVGPNPTTTSQTWFGVFAMPATPTVARAFWGINTNNVSALACRAMHLPTSGKLRFQVASSNIDSANTYSSGNHPVIVKYDRTNSTAVMYTDLEKLSNTYNSGIVDQLKGVGSSASDAVGMVYAIMWSGSAAEISDADMKALLVALGYSIPWAYIDTARIRVQGLAVVNNSSLVWG